MRHAARREQALATAEEHAAGNKAALDDAGLLPALARLLESPDPTLVQATVTSLLLFAVPDPEPLAQVATPETATALVAVLNACGRPPAAAAPPPSLSPSRSPARYGATTAASAAAAAAEPSRLTCLATQLLALLALRNADVGAAIHAAAGLPTLTALLVPSSGAKVAGAAASCVLAVSLSSSDGRTAVLTSGAVEKLAELSRGKADLSDFLRQAMWRILKPLVPPPAFIAATPRASMHLGASPARAGSGGGGGGGSGSGGGGALRGSTSIEAAARAVAAAAAGASPARAPPAPGAARPATPLASHPLRFNADDGDA